MLSLLRTYTLVPTLRLKPFLLPVATRHFLTTSLNKLPAKKGGDQVSSKPLAEQKSEKPIVKKVKFTKKDLTPPHKRPLAPFAAYTSKKMQELRAKGVQVIMRDILPQCGAEWRKLSEAEKQSYAPTPEAFEAHRAALQEWKASLSPKAKTALKIRRRRKMRTGLSLFASETFGQAAGDTFGEKISNRAATWNALSDEVKADYKTRAAKTLFGSLIKRATQSENQKARAAALKKKLQEKKEKERAAKKKLQEKVKAKKLELKEMAKKKAKMEALKRQLKKQGSVSKKSKAKQDLGKMKAVKAMKTPVKQKVKATT